MTSTTILGHDLASASISVPFLVLLVSCAYLVCNGRSKSAVPTSVEPSPEVVFDTSNIRVAKILIHPIKSCKGTSVQQAKYNLEGFEYDRNWCIVNAGDNAVITARQVSKMLLIHPRIIAEPASPDGGRLEVSFPENSGCETFSVPLILTEERAHHLRRVDVALWGKSDIDGYVCESVDGPSPSTVLSQYFGYPVHLVIKGPRPRICPPTQRFPKLDTPSHFQDGYPLMMMSQESVTAVQEKVREMIGQQGVGEVWALQELVVERFRPNIVIKGAGSPFVEDTITELVITSQRQAVDSAVPRINLVSKCTRCLLPNVDTVTGIRDNAVPYKAMMKFRRGKDPLQPSAPCLGCNGVFTGEGIMRVGDWVHVRRTGFV